MSEITLRLIVEIPCSSPPSLQLAEWEANELRGALDHAGWDTSRVRVSVDETTTDEPTSERN